MFATISSTTLDFDLECILFFGDESLDFLYDGISIPLRNASSFGDGRRGVYGLTDIDMVDTGIVVEEGGDCICSSFTSKVASVEGELSSELTTIAGGVEFESLVTVVLLETFDALVSETIDVLDVLVLLRTEFRVVRLVLLV